MEPAHTDVTVAPMTEAELFQRMEAHGVEAIAESCRPVTDILNRVGDKWSVMVVMVLGAGPKRFNELRRTINGISQRMLTLTLRGLERDGLVSRTVFPTVPPRVDYALTELGQSLRGPIEALGQWAFANQAKVEEARARFDRQAAG